MFAFPFLRIHKPNAKPTLVCCAHVAIKDVQTLRRVYEDALAEYEDVRANEGAKSAVAREKARELERLETELGNLRGLIGLQEAELRVLADRVKVCHI